MTVRASAPRTCRTSSIGSIAPQERPAAGPGWVSRLPSGSLIGTAAASWSPTAPRAVPGSLSTCRRPGSRPSDWRSVLADQVLVHSLGPDRPPVVRDGVCGVVVPSAVAGEPGQALEAHDDDGGCVRVGECKSRANDGDAAQTGGGAICARVPDMVAAL